MKNCDSYWVYVGLGVGLMLWYYFVCHELFSNCDLNPGQPLIMMKLSVIKEWINFLF